MKTEIYTEQEKDFLIQALTILCIEYSLKESTEGITHYVFTFTPDKAQIKPLNALMEYNYNKEITQ